MRRALLTLTFLSGALAATGVAAQTQFPLSASHEQYSTPFVGVETVGLVQEGRSAFAPGSAEAIVTFESIGLPQEDVTLPTVR